MTTGGYRKCWPRHLTITANLSDMRGQCTIGASKNAGKILEHFRNKNLPLVHVQHLSSENESPVFAVGSEDVKIHNNIKSLEGEKIGSKNTTRTVSEKKVFYNIKVDLLGW